MGELLILQGPVSLRLNKWNQVAPYRSVTPRVCQMEARVYKWNQVDTFGSVARIVFNGTKWTRNGPFGHICTLGVVKD